MFDQVNTKFKDILYFNLYIIKKINIYMYVKKKKKSILINIHA